MISLESEILSHKHTISQQIVEIDELKKDKTDSMNRSQYEIERFKLIESK